MNWKGGYVIMSLTSLEMKIFNNGERLIPGITHNQGEVIRHKSSYEFFKLIIENDIKKQKLNDCSSISIVDLGCGVGHGCKTLSKIRNVQITGIDISPDSLEYAKIHYAAENITYQVANLIDFVPNMPEYNYVVSRNAFEHVPDGIELALLCKWRYRLIFDVPYAEKNGANRHHRVTGIREDNFIKFSEVELFYQDRQGIIFNSSQKPRNPNIIICVSSNLNLPKINSTDIHFPVPAWHG
jgi:SAM-dependent methyltransferase